MKKFADFICEHQKLVIGLSIILFVLSLIGNALTKINYDILVYLPEEIETIKGQNILTDDFNMGGYSIAVLEGMNSKDVLKLENDLKKIDGVGEVVSLYDVVGTSIPVEMLPEEIVSKLHDEDSDLLFITFLDSTSSERTINAVQEIRDITDEHVKLGGMSSMVLDTMNLSNKEIAIYIVIAVLLCILVLELSLDSYVVPIILLANIGVAIIFNLGSNLFLGQISYITKALVAVLQLGVTTDFSIFLYHSYEKKKDLYGNRKEAMSKAILETFTSVTGSSLTTIAGFLVLITMNLTLGADLGIVMAKGVFLGVITVLTLFPSLLLAFDKIIEKTKHKVFIPNFSKLYQWVIKYHKIIFAAFLILLVPFYLANSKVEVYYKIDKTLPETLESIEANKELKEKFNIVSANIILLDKNMKTDTMQSLVADLEQVPGIDFVLSLSKLKEMGITDNMIPEELLQVVESEQYQMLMFNSLYDIASDELNDQITVVNDMIKKYDKKAIVAGEGPLMKDLITISDTDFKNVNVASIVCIFFILFIVLKSFSLPFLLIITIEFAIFLNMGISYFGGTILPFVAPIVLGTIQLGATIDYAILMTTTYLEKRKEGIEKKKAIYDTLSYSGNSIFVSGMCFFAATFGVGVYSDLEMVGSLCTLISRGAIVSMLVVIMVLPSILLLFDKLIMKTTYKGKDLKLKMKKNHMKKACALLLIGSALLVSPLSVKALTKEETVYTKLNTDGTINHTFVNSRLMNTNQENTLEDYSELKDILNLNNNNSYQRVDNKLVWNALGKDVVYQGTTAKALPVKVNIKYYLDDKEMDVNDIIGKSGHVKIVFDYENTDKHVVTVNGKKETLYTPFLVTMGTIIDVDGNSNVTVSNGKVINNGTKNVVVGMAMPGLYESLKLSELKNMDKITISYETTKFELASIYSIVTPKVISSDDLTIFKQMDSLYGSINTLQKGMNQIEDGVKELSLGSSKLSTGATNLNRGIEEAQKQFQAIKSGSVQLNTGIKSLVTILDNVMVQVDGFITEIQNTTSIDDPHIQTLLQGNAAMMQKYATDADLVALLQGNSLFINETITSLKKLEELKSQVSTLVGGLKTNLSEIEKLQKGSTDLMNGIAAFDSEALAVMAAGSHELSVGANALHTGIGTLEKGIVTYNQTGISKITSLVNNNVKGMSNKVKALVKLGEDYESFAGMSKNDNGETKFVLVIDGKKAPKEEIKTNTTTKKVSLWQRIKNLFK